MLAARATALAAALTLSLPVAPARAAEPDLHAEPVLRHAERDIYIALAGYGLTLGLELAKPSLAPESCRWCGTNGFDDGVRNALVWADVGRARTTSDMLAYVVMPASAATYLLLAGKNGPGLKEGAWDLVYVAEAGALAMSLTSVAKLIAGRQRPYAVHGNYVEADRGPTPDDNLSFWSGHTAFTFAIASAAGTVASMRGRDEAPWVWTTGMVLASATAYFRIAGDKHHFTDVLAGAAVGTAFGVGVPRLLHSAQDPGQTSVTVIPLPLGFAGTF